MIKRSAYFTIDRAIQGGSILLVCLIFLLVLTLMAVRGMETTILEERMAGNLQQQSRMFQSAEASLQKAEKWLRTQTVLPPVGDNDDGGNTTVWRKNSAMQPADSKQWWLERDASWWKSEAITFPGGMALGIQTQYIIEQYFTGDSGMGLNIGDGNAKRKRIIHRVTASAWERDNEQENILVQLQVTHMWPYY